MLRGMGIAGRIAFATVLAAAAALAFLAAVAGWWVYTVIAVLFGVIFALTAPFVLGRRWKRPVPRPTKRPVVKRRR